MAQFNLSNTVDSSKVFLVNRSEIFERLDPDMVSYNKKTKSYKFKTFPLKSLLKKAPQYGANESGIERISFEEPRYIRITDIDEYGLLKDNIGVTAENIEDRFILNDNDILFARSGNTVGKAYLHKKANVNYDCFFAGYMIRFIVDETKILSDYLFTYTQLNIYKNWVNAIQRTAGQPNINAEEYKSLLIPLPPIDIQQKIVEKINFAYTQKQQKEAEAKALLASIDVYLLNELGITLPEKDTSLQSRIFTTMFSEVSGGRFDPKYNNQFYRDFEKQISNYKLLSKYIKVRTGDPFSSEDFDKGTIPLIRIREIKRGQLNFENGVLLEDKFYDKFPNSIPIDNELLIGMDGDEFRCVKYEEKLHGKILINQRVAIINCNQEVLNPDYLEYLINSMIVINQFDRNRSVAGTIAHISSSDIRSLRIPLPSLEKQTEIANHIQAIRAQAKRLQEDAKAVLEEVKREVEKMILG